MVEIREANNETSNSEGTVLSQPTSKKSKKLKSTPKMIEIPEESKRKELETPGFDNSQYESTRNVSPFEL